MRVVVRKKEAGDFAPLIIHTDFIRLDAALKLAGAAPTGGLAKAGIQEGSALVNGEVCTMRGKKLYPGDTVDFLGWKFRIVHEAP